MAIDAAARAAIVTLQLQADGEQAGGDSAGPLLGFDTRRRSRVLGILSRGSSDCAGRDLYVRADIARTFACDEGMPCDHCE